MTLPDLWLMLSQTVIVFDNLKDTLFLIHHADSNQPDAYKTAQQKLDQLEQLLATLSAYKRNLILRHFNPLQGKEKF